MAAIHLPFGWENPPITVNLSGLPPLPSLTSEVTALLNGNAPTFRVKALAYLGDAVLSAYLRRKYYKRFALKETDVSGLTILASLVASMEQNTTLSVLSMGYGWLHPQTKLNSQKGSADVFEAVVGGLSLSKNEGGVRGLEQWLDQVFSEKVFRRSPTLASARKIYEKRRRFPRRTKVLCFVKGTSTVRGNAVLQRKAGTRLEADGVSPPYLGASPPLRDSSSCMVLPVREDIHLDIPEPHKRVSEDMGICDSGDMIICDSEDDSDPCTSELSEDLNPHDSDENKLKISDAFTIGDSESSDFSSSDESEDNKLYTSDCKASHNEDSNSSSSDDRDDSDSNSPESEVVKSGQQEVVWYSTYRQTHTRPGDGASLLLCDPNGCRSEDSYASSSSSSIQSEDSDSSSSNFCEDEQLEIFDAESSDLDVDSDSESNSSDSSDDVSSEKARLVKLLIVNKRIEHEASSLQDELDLPHTHSPSALETLNLAKKWLDSGLCEGVYEWKREFFGGGRDLQEEEKVKADFILLDLIDERMRIRL
ncbi:hypothetical protein P7C70_g4125, partial [Phenoliferia sp. Uapishka_3]